MKKLVRFDEALDVRADLNQEKIRETAFALIATIDAAVRVAPDWNATLQPLRAYAQAGIDGRITMPRIWAEEPLGYEYGEHLLPESVVRAYGDFAFWTHGLTFDAPMVRYIDGVAYIEVDE